MAWTRIPPTFSAALGEAMISPITSPVPAAHTMPEPTPAKSDAPTARKGARTARATQKQRPMPKTSNKPLAETPDAFRTQAKVRLVTATALFDGHDASINIMRRIAQAGGAEVIHLGHNRSVQEIVDAAIQEDAQGIAITSYQGGHNEFFRYMREMLVERGAEAVRIFGGGGGVILPEEIEALHEAGIERIYSPDDGRALGLEGMVHDMLKRCDFDTLKDESPAALLDALAPAKGKGTGTAQTRITARAITRGERGEEAFGIELKRRVSALKVQAPVLGITGTGGAGKSSLIDELVRRFLTDQSDKTIAVLSVDPSRRKTGGALLGDRIRMNAITNDRAFMRSMATRRANLALAESVDEALAILKLANFDLIVLESSGIGQSDTEIVDHADLALYVMTPEFGAATQLEKIDMLDYADVVAINKFDRRGAADALRDVKKQVQRNKKLFETPAEDMPVFGTIASQFADTGTDQLYRDLLARLSALRPNRFAASTLTSLDASADASSGAGIIPGARVRYLAEIAESNAGYAKLVEEQVAAAERLWVLRRACDELGSTDSAAAKSLAKEAKSAAAALNPENLTTLEGWDAMVAAYATDEHVFTVRGKEIAVEQFTKSLSGLRIPKVALPKFSSWGDRLRWLMTENVSGAFPFAAGVFPFKRTREDPTRMFAGEGGPERTNRRFHYVSKGQPAKRLSTAFDSVTLYGEDPGRRPDIYGKVGNAGVSICSLDDAKRLYSGFDLADPTTSVSMTINGPAPMLLAFFMNAAIDQQCEKYIREAGLVEDASKRIAVLQKKAGGPPPIYRGDLPEGNDGLGTMLLGVTGKDVLPDAKYFEIADATVQQVRGTVQADILKEDQAQNTCIFSTEFALRLMGDVQSWFTEHKVRNFYSVSISGYHIAEAGANPVTQLAFTLANGFTYVEYYLSRGMAIDDFAPNLSFFFSNGLDPEYAVIGRVARRIWAKAMKLKYGANERSQKLKYHIQTSGRSLHAQEIDFNDIRTTLQALYAIYDNCQSLHTNAFDEAITTPTEDSVRRAMAIQLIINKELGMTLNENPLQGAFIIDELTDLVEEAVCHEFISISERGGVLGAMETMYQRGKIQDESLYYERLKSSGEMPIVGVNTFLGRDGSPIHRTEEVMRSSDEEKEAQVERLERFHARHAEDTPAALAALSQTALTGGNVFAALMDAAKVCSLGQLSQALYSVGGQYRRNM